MSIAVLIAALAAGQAAAKADLSRHIYPLAPPKPCPPITVDLSESPESEAWAEEAKKLAASWWPHLCQLLSTQEFTPPKSIKFMFRKKQDAPAYATRNEISFSVDWITKHPEDMGVVIHELTHLVQAYPANKADTGWLVEGIADYIRWWRFEPEALNHRINWDKASYKDGYGTAAWLLAWAGRRFSMGLVPALDSRLRKGEDPYPVLERVTGMTMDDLWKEFRAANEGKKL